MAKIYANLIKNSYKTIKDVPDILKSEVEAELARQGYDISDNPID